MKFSLNIVHVFIFISITIGYVIEGNDTYFKSIEENVHLDEQLHILNKPPIKTFKKNGDIIDCVDINKQPAFDHPLLKNHKLQMRPSSIPKPTKRVSRKKSPQSTIRSKGKVEKCPNGSVPFRRIQREDLIRGKALLNQRHPRFGSKALALTKDVHYAAGTTSVKDPLIEIYGAKTALSVYNLTTVVSPQFTEALLWIGTGVDGAYNSIEYGWTVNPQLYNDNNPRTYSLWTADGLQNTGCYNALCSGYVQVSRERIMGAINNPVSKFGETVYAMEFSIFRDRQTGNWWLYERLTGAKNEPVGYWPKELFPSMKDYAIVVQFGGKVYSPSNMPHRTPMGSGAFMQDDFTRTCYASNLEFVNSNYQFYTPEDLPIQATADEPDVYKAAYLGNVSKDHPGRGYTLVFGGPNVYH